MLNGTCIAANMPYSVDFWNWLSKIAFYEVKYFEILTWIHSVIIRKILNFSTEQK